MYAYMYSCSEGVTFPWTKGSPTSSRPVDSYYVNSCNVKRGYRAVLSRLQHACMPCCATLYPLPAVSSVMLSCHVCLDAATSHPLDLRHIIAAAPRITPFRAA